MIVARRKGEIRAARQSEEGAIEVLGGCTLIFDLDSVELKYAIPKRLLDPEALDRGERRINIARVEGQHRYQTEILPLSVSEAAGYFGAGLNDRFVEPFSIMHNS